MKPVRNIPPSLLRDLGMDDEIQTLVEEEQATPVSEFKELTDVARRIRPRTLAKPQNVIHTLKEEDEFIFAANHPGDLQRLGFTFYTWTNDVQIPEDPTSRPQQVFEIEIKKRDVFVMLDWRNYALKNVGGDLFPMNPGELQNENFAITIRKAGSKGAGLGFWAYGPGRAVAGANQFEMNAIGSIDQGSTFVWPGRFRYIIRGPERLSVYVHYKQAAFPPYSIPAVFASKLMGFYRFG